MKIYRSIEVCNKLNFSPETVRLLETILGKISDISKCAKKYLLQRSLFFLSLKEKFNFITDLIHFFYNIESNDKKKNKIYLTF